MKKEISINVKCTRGKALKGKGDFHTGYAKES